MVRVGHGFTQYSPCTQLMAASRNHSGLPEFPSRRRKIEDMERSHTNPGDPGMEFQRQLRSHQLRRFVGTMPHFAVQTELPSRFVELLRELERVGEGLDRGSARRAD